MWTLVDAPAAFAEWFAVLRPGGKLLIVDGNMGAKQAAQVEITRRSSPGHGPCDDGQHKSSASTSRSRCRPAVVKELLKVGFVDPIDDRAMFDIHFAQARKMPTLWRALERLASDRYAICVTKPR